MCDRIVLSPYEFISISVPAKAAAALSLAVVLEKRFIHSICCAVKNRSAPRPSFVRVCVACVVVRWLWLVHRNTITIIWVGGSRTGSGKGCCRRRRRRRGTRMRAPNMCAKQMTIIFTLSARVYVCVCVGGSGGDNGGTNYTHALTPHTHTQAYTCAAE